MTAKKVLFFHDGEKKHKNMTLTY